MKEAIVGKDLKVTIRDVELPLLPSQDHVIIKVHVSGSNPKDWATAERCEYPQVKRYRCTKDSGLIHFGT